MQSPTLQEFYDALGSEEPLKDVHPDILFAQMKAEEVPLAKQILAKISPAEKPEYILGILGSPNVSLIDKFNEFLLPVIEQDSPPLDLQTKTQLLYGLTKDIKGNSAIAAFNQMLAPDQPATSAEPETDLQPYYEAALRACRDTLQKTAASQTRLESSRSARSIPRPLRQTAREATSKLAVTKAMLQNISLLKQALDETHENDTQRKLAEIERILAEEKQRKTLTKKQRQALNKLYRSYLETLSVELRQASAILFLNIPKEELSNIKEPRPESIQQLTRAYNTLTNYITEEITFAESKAQRALIMERWVAILQRSMELGNFTIASAIQASFDAVPIARFNITDDLSDTAKQVLEHLRYDGKSVTSFFGLRISQDRQDQYIPHYGWYISLFTINDGKVDETQGKELIERLNLADKIIEKKDWTDAVMLLDGLLAKHKESLEKNGLHETYTQELAKLVRERKEADVKIAEIEKRILAAHAAPAEAKRLREQELEPLKLRKIEQDEKLAELKNMMREHIAEINPQDLVIKELEKAKSQQRTDLEEVKSDLAEISKQLGALSSEKKRIKDRIAEGKPQEGDQERLEAIGTEFKDTLNRNKRRLEQLNQLLVDGSEHMLSDDKDFWAGELKKLDEKYQNAYAGFKKANDEVIEELSRKQKALLPKPAAAALSPFTRSVMEGRSDEEIRVVEKRCEEHSKPYKDDAVYKSAKCDILQKKNYKKFILTEESSAVKQITGLLNLVFREKDELIKQLKEKQSHVEPAELKPLITGIYVTLGNGNISPLEKLEFLRESMQKFDAQKHGEILDILVKLARLHENICGMAAQQSSHTLEGLRTVRTEVPIDVNEAYIRELIQGHPEWPPSLRVKMIETAFAYPAVQEFLRHPDNQSLSGELTRAYAEAQEKSAGEKKAVSTAAATTIPLAKRKKSRFFPRRESHLATLDIKQYLDGRLKNIERMMYDDHNPCCEELQKLLSEEPYAASVRKQLKQDHQMFTRFQRLYEQSADMMADSLVAYDAQLFSQLNTHELYRNPAKDAQPTVQPCVDLLNRLSGYVIDDIQSRTSLNERTLALEHWIRIAYKCLHHSNIPDMHLAFCFSTTFSNAGISRLKTAMLGLSPQAREMLNDIDAITSPFGSFKNARSFLTSHPHACPSMSLVFTDMEFFAQGNQDIHPQIFHDTQNYVEKLKARVSEIHQRQEKWKFAPDPLLIQSIHASHHTGSEQAEKASRLQASEELQSHSTLLTEFNLFPQSRMKSEATTAATLVQPPQAPRSRPDKLIIILHEENHQQLSRLAFLPGCEFVLASDLPHPGLPGNPRQVARSGIILDGKSLDTLLDEKRQSYSASQEEKIKLYSLVVYGDERTIDLDRISPAARERIERTIKEGTFVDTYFEQAKPLLEKHFTALYLQEQLKVPQRNIIDIEEYARAVVNNTQHYLLDTQNLTDDDPLKKAIAMLYLALTQPDLFTPSIAGENTIADDGKTRLEKKSRCDAMEKMLTRLDESDLQILRDWLQSPLPDAPIGEPSQDRKPTRTLFDSLPETVKEPLGNQYQRDIMLARTVSETYQTEHDFIRQMQAFVNHFCDASGNLKPDSEFLAAHERKLSAKERALLAYFLEPYKILARDTLGQQPANNSEAIRNFSKMLAENPERNQAFIAAAANQLVFQALITHISKDAFKPVPFVRSGNREADADYVQTNAFLPTADFPIMPVQRMPRIGLLSRELNKYAPAKR
ncbi:RasGEF domain-containing protein [Aquicella siphonis]|nr:RasGEF domain-containing protein [Aquicella siphonis]